MHIVRSIRIGIYCACAMLSVAYAQKAIQTVPAGVTAVCRDGSYSKAVQKRGACSRHQGVQTWYGTEIQQGARAKTGRASPLLQATPTSQEPSIVWVNLTSQFFHCQGSRWYGKTKHGVSMPQTEAIVRNYKPSGGKWCSTAQKFE